MCCSTRSSPRIRVHPQAGRADLSHFDNGSSKSSLARYYRACSNGIKQLRSRRELGRVLVGAGVGIAAFILYLLTLAPTVLTYERPLQFDSPMLQAQAATLGIGHPTGYPGYMLLTHLFTYLPFGDVAYRVNLASAVYAAVAVSLVYAIGLRLSGRAVAAAVGALAFGVGGTFWSQAVIAEVHTLNVLLVASVVLTLILWRDSRNNRYLLAAALLTGLSMTNHMTSGILIPVGLAFVVVVAPRTLLRARLMVGGLGAFALGLSLYLYLPIRAFMQAPLNEADPSTPGRFLTLVSGGGMEGQAFSYGIGQLSGRLSTYVDYLLQDFSWSLVLLGCLGALRLLIKDEQVMALLGLLYIGWLTFALGYDILDVSLYFIPTYLIFGLWIAVGAGTLLEVVGVLGRQFLLRSRRSFVKGAAFAVFSTLLATLPLVGLKQTYAEEDRSGDYRGREVIEAVAEHAEEGATVLHYRSPLWYMVLVEERRRDLTLVAAFDTPWIRYQDIVWPNPENPETTARYREDTTGVWAMRKALKQGAVYILDQQSASPAALREAGYGFREVDEEGGLYRIVPAGSKA